MPQIIEWKGTGRAPGDEVAPIDLRVDHVYLVSCKYLSKILFNVSPASVFDALLFGGTARGARGARDVVPGGGDWYAEVAPAEYQALYDCVRQAARAPTEAAPPSRASVVPDGTTRAPAGGRCAPRTGGARRRRGARRRAGARHRPVPPAC